jgi:hypothetical protein
MSPSVDARTPFAREQEAFWSRLAAYHAAVGDDDLAIRCQRYAATWAEPGGRPEECDDDA